MQYQKKRANDDSSGEERKSDIVISSQSSAQNRNDQMKFESPTKSISIPSTNKEMSSEPRAIKRRKKDYDPRRPIRARSAYNFFYQYQRQILLNSMLSGENIENHADGTDNRETTSEKTKDTKEVHAELRKRYFELFGSNKPVRKKRAHRKTPGKIEMRKLTKMVAMKWKNTGEDVRSFFQIESDKDLHRYRIEMREYLAKKKEDSLQQDIQPDKYDEKSLKMIEETESQAGSESFSTTENEDDNLYSNIHAQPFSHEAYSINKDSLASSLSNNFERIKDSEIGSNSVDDNTTYAQNKDHDQLLLHERFSFANQEADLEQGADSPPYPTDVPIREATGSLYGYDISPDKAKSLLRSKPSWYKHG